MKTLLKIFTIICLWMIFPGTAFTQDPVSLNCLQVENNGDVKLLWSPPANTMGFEKYEIYFSPNGTSYTKLTDIGDVNTNQFLHSGADANTGSRYYFIQTGYTASNPESDTLKTIYLQLDNLNFNEAKLYWNDIFAHPAGKGPTTFKIYKRYSMGTWNLVKSLTNEFETSVPVVVCKDSVYFRVNIENTDCQSVSNVKGDWFKNLEEPPKPVIDSVSINQNEHSVIGWEPVGSASAYIIYRFDAGIWTSIDTVYGGSNTFYEDTFSSPCSASLTYSVATIDTCGSSGPKDENEKRKTLRIENAAFNPCEETISLSWNAYRGPDAENYEIWVSENDGDFVFAATTGLNDTLLSYDVPDIGSRYSFFVRAKFPSGTSTSCKVVVSTYSYSKPQFVYFANADVLPDNNIDLTIEVDTLVGGCSWEIYQVFVSAVVVNKIATLQKNQLSSYPLTYTDTTAAPELSPFEYYVYVFDSCDNEVLESNFLKTVFLTGNSINSFQNQLQWTAFEGWEGGVEKYYIYRMINNVEPTAPIDSVSGQTLEYTDDLSIFSNTSIIPVYWVQAVEGAGNSHGLQEKARSNRISLSKNSEMYMANAFKPGGTNPEYKPVFTVNSGKNYLFQIYSRWGNLLFETTNPGQGWDGKNNGRFVETGVYAYRLVYENPDESTTVKTGTVTVIY